MPASITDRTTAKHRLDDPSIHPSIQATCPCPSPRGCKCIEDRSEEIVSVQEVREFDRWTDSHPELDHRVGCPFNAPRDGASQGEDQQLLICTRWPKDIHNTNAPNPNNFYLNPPYFFNVQSQVIDPCTLLKHLPTSAHSSVKLLPLQSRPLHVVTLQSLSLQRQYPHQPLNDQARRTY